MVEEVEGEKQYILENAKPIRTMNDLQDSEQHYKQLYESVTQELEALKERYDCSAKPKRR